MMTKKEFIGYLKNDLELEEGEEIFKVKYNEGQTSYFAIKSYTEYGTETYELYGISGDGNEVWTEENTHKKDNTYRWPSGDEDEI